MQHPDEGTIHAWLDDALPAGEAAALETHVASCAACAALVAEARGLIAASSRILSALDDVPAQVVPAGMARDGAAQDPGAIGDAPLPAMPEPTADVIPLRLAILARRSRRRLPGLAAAAALLLVAGSTAVLMRRGDLSVARPEQMAMASDTAAPSGLPSAPLAGDVATADAAQGAAPSAARIGGAARDEGASAGATQNVAALAEAASAPPPAPAPNEAPTAARSADRAAGARRQGFAGADAPPPTVASAPIGASSNAPISAPSERDLSARVAAQRPAMREAPAANDGRALAATAQSRDRGAVLGQVGAGAGAPAGPVPTATAPAAAPTLADAAKIAASEREERRRDVRADADSALPVVVTGAAASSTAPSSPSARRIPASRLGAAASFTGCWEVVRAPWLPTDAAAPRRFRLTTDSASAGYVARALPSGAAGTWRQALDAIVVTIPGWPARQELVRSADGSELTGGGVTARRAGC